MKKGSGPSQLSCTILSVALTFLSGFILFSFYGNIVKSSPTGRDRQTLKKNLLSAPRGTETNKEADPYLRRGLIHPLLHQQGLSHIIFHNYSFQELLASIIPKKYARSVLVAGVEWGGDVKHFAEIGYRVIAFEPLTWYFDNLEKYFKPSDDEQPRNVTLFNMAVGNESGTLDVTYQYRKQSVPIVRIDDKVNEPVSLLMADVQGNELSVLQGALGLLRSSVQMVWVEAFSCNPKVALLLDLLDKENFIIFDFAPWGRPPGQDLSVKPLERGNFGFYPDRPSQFEKYLEWFCDLKENITMLQTDFVAIKRTLHPIATSRLQNIGSVACQSGNHDCVLRTHLRSIFK